VKKKNDAVKKKEGIVRRRRMRAYIKRLGFSI
jgi:hypothetical protein